MLAAAVLILLAGCTGGGHSAPTGGTTTTPPTGRSRVLPVRVVLPQLEHFVEQERGLTFKRPVKVQLLGRKAFVAKLDEGQKKPKASEVEKETAVLASLGLISPHVDLVRAFRTATDAGTLGFYSFKTKRLYVRGTRATPGVRAVLTHELTHALTDQWFGLRRKGLNKGNLELQTGFTALTEGDAERTRVAYEHTLSPADRRIAQREEGGNSKPPPVPRVVLELIGFPYAVGPRFVDALVTQGGLAELNNAYRHPPTSSEQLIDPQTYFSRDQPKHVAKPRADGPIVDHGDLGLIGLLLMLEHRLDRPTSGRAVIGWGGDEFTAWRAGDHRWCLRDTVVMDYGAALSALAGALTQWAAKSGGLAHVEQVGSSVTFRTCSG
ncbi:MAG: hypothetical protein JO222_04695 [Frankiales bacterium]|nr:hypothetical protein [Frankiales bacterium]